MLAQRGPGLRATAVADAAAVAAAAEKAVQRGPLGAVLGLSLTMKSCLCKTLGPCQIKQTASKDL